MHVGCTFGCLDNGFRQMPIYLRDRQHTKYLLHVGSARELAKLTSPTMKVSQIALIKDGYNAILWSAAFE